MCVAGVPRIRAAAGRQFRPAQNKMRHNRKITKVMRNVCVCVCVVHSGAPSKTKLHMNGDASSGGRGEGKGDKNNPISMQILLYSSTFSRTFLHVSAGVPKNLFDYFHMCVCLCARTFFSTGGGDGGKLASGEIVGMCAAECVCVFAHIAFNSTLVNSGRRDNDPPGDRGDVPVILAPSARSFQL